jgi:hypothetical protein
MTFASLSQSLFSGHSLERLGRVGPGYEVIDLALRRTSDDAGDDVAEIG